MRIEDCFELGYIVKARGLSGEVTVFFDADNPERYGNIDAVFVENGSHLIPYMIEEIQPLNDKYILKLEDINDTDAANALKGSKLYLPLEALPPIGDDEYYLHDLVGFTVKDDEKGELGVVNNVIDLNNNLLISLVYQGKEVLIPVNDEVVYKVDKSENVLFTNLPEGLLALYLDA